MIAADTSTWIAFLEGDGGDDTQLLDRALGDQQVLMAPVVLTDVLSDPELPPAVAQTLLELPLSRSVPAIGNGQARCERAYWQRAERRDRAMP
jgi:hypothetical protein